MRKLATFLFILCMPFFVSAQTTVFHEDFELPGLDDSVVNSSIPASANGFAINSRLHSGPNSLHCDSCQVKTSTKFLLNTQAFSTLGNFYIILSFDQICKVEATDYAKIEVSADSGITWTQLTAVHYKGTGSFTAPNYSFNTNTYGVLWEPSNPAVTQNSWWKSESFDVSALVSNCANAMVRFSLYDYWNDGSYGYSGWFLDNIKVTGLYSEPNPPVIMTPSPLISGVISTTGPFTIKTRITDPSGIASASVIYTVNNGLADTIPMIALTNDTMMCILPAVTELDEVCWRIEAYDNSPAHNWNRYPLSTCNSFTVVTLLSLPYTDNFDGPLSYWIPSFGSTNQNSKWQLGIPAYSPTTTTHSAPKAWDINLTTAYSFMANCILTSPRFDFSGAFNASMEFWLNYQTETNYDGTRLEYTVDGVNWLLLGILNDPLGTNWYTHNLVASGKPGWHGASPGWRKSTYKLKVLDYAGNHVQFRFVFQSDATSNYAGVTLDDFKIMVPPPQEAVVTAIVTPNGNCGMGNEPISIKIFNGGTQNIAGGLTAGFKTNPTSPTVLEMVTDTIHPGDTLLYHFNTPANYLAVNQDSTFKLTAWVRLVNDTNFNNDSLHLQVLSRFKPIAPTAQAQTITNNTNTIVTAASPYTVNWFASPSGGTALGTGLNFTTPLLYATTIYYVQATAANTCSSNRTPVTISVNMIPPYDAAILSLTSPSTGLNLSATSQVKILLRNYGTLVLNTFHVSYKVNNGPTVTETVNTPLAAGDTTTYTFNTTANLSAYITYSLKAWTQAAGDVNPENDSISKSVVNSMYTYCISKPNYSTYDDIGNVKISNLNNGIALPVLNNATANQAYSNFITSVAPITLIQGQTYPISISAIFTSVHFACYCKVYVDWNFDGLFTEATEMAFFGGPTTASNATLTGSITVPINAVTAPTRFRVVLCESISTAIQPCNTYSYGETEDYTAQIVPMTQHDAGITQVSAPDSLYQQGTTGSLTATLKNFGAAPITSLLAGYILDNNPAVMMPWTGNLANSNTTQISFPAVTWPTGTHSLRVFSQLSNDTTSFNDTTYKTIVGVSLDTLPYFDNFDQLVHFTNSGTGGTNWVHASPSSQNWPLTAISQPNIWATNLNQGGYTALATCYLTTQAFSYANTQNARISFWYNCNIPFDGDGVKLQYSSDLGITWTNLGALNDPQGINWYNVNTANLGPAWAGNSGGWKKAFYTLPKLSNTYALRFRFVFQSNTTLQSDGFAIDDFNILLRPPTDAGILSLASPTQNSNIGASFPVKMNAKNLGATDITGMSISYVLDNNNVVTQTWSGVLKPDSLAEITFPSVFLSMGAHVIKAYTTLTGDNNPENDTLLVNYPCMLSLNALGNLQQTIQNLLVGPQGTVSNVSYAGNVVATGTYETGCGILGLTHGILMTTGNYLFAQGPNNTSSKGLDNGYDGVDNDLVSLADGAVYNRYLIEFDFVPFADAITFKFVFGSEEYKEYIFSQYSDAFGIFVSGPGLSGPYTNNAENIAVVPGTNLTIAVNNINNGTSNTGPCVNCEYYVDNTGGITLQYDGYTTPLIASRTLIPLQQYHVKIVIGDLTDPNYDSGLFIEAGEYDDHKLDYNLSIQQSGNPLNSNTYTYEGCSYAMIDIHRNFATEDTTYVLIDSIYGTAVNGIDYTGISDSILFLPNQLHTQLQIQPLVDGITEGTEYIILKLKSSTLFNTDTILSIPIHDYTPISIETISDTLLGPAQFELQLWVNATNGLPPYMYSWTPANSLSNAGIANPVATPQYNSWYYVEVSDTTQCAAVKDSVFVQPTTCSAISGNITYDNTTATYMNNTVVGLYHENVLVQNVSSDLNGYYSFDSICEPGAYSLKLSSAKPWGGVNSTDGMLVMKHFVGLSTLTPFRQKAADVSLNGLVNSQDVLQILKRFVGQTSAFPGGDWVFQDGPIIISAGAHVQKDIKALCYGDVDGSLIPGLKTRPALQMLTAAEELAIIPNQSFDLPVFAEFPGECHALSLVLQYDTLLAEILDIVPAAMYNDDAGTSFVYHVMGDQIRIAWYSLNQGIINNKQTMFFVRMKAHKAEPLQFSILDNSALADLSGNSLAPASLSIPKLVDAVHETRFTAFPNPVEDQLLVQYAIPISGVISFHLINELGQECLSVSATGQAGSSTETISLKHLAAGIYKLEMRFSHDGIHEIKRLKVIKI